MSWFDDFERMRREMERLTRGLQPTLDLLRQIEHQYDFVRFNQELRRSTEAASRLAEPLRRLAQSDHLRQFSEEIAKRQLDITRLLTDVRQFYGGPLAEVALSVRAVAAVAGPFPVAQWYEELAARAEVLEREEGLEPAEARARVERPLVEAVAKLPVTPATVQFIISTLLTLFLFWLGLRLSAQSENRILERIGDLETEMSEAFESFLPEADAVGVRVVRRATTVLSRPSGRQGGALGMIYPGQLVTVVERRGKWVKIEWTDMSSRSLKAGWVLRKYLGRVRQIQTR
jgi:hypothetical protein